MSPMGKSRQPPGNGAVGWNRRVRELAQFEHRTSRGECLTGGSVPGGNEAPVLTPLADAVVAPGGLLEVTLAATDLDVPPNNLT
jgi:hypothetical protein